MKHPFLKIQVLFIHGLVSAQGQSFDWVRVKLGCLRSGVWTNSRAAIQACITSEFQHILYCYFGFDALNLKGNKTGKEAVVRCRVFRYFQGTDWMGTDLRIEQEWISALRWNGTETLQLQE